MLRCSAATGRWPVSGTVLSLLSRRYVNCATDYAVDVASRTCHASTHIHAGVNIKQLYKNTAALLKPLSRVISVQLANRREDVAPPNKKNSAHRNISVRYTPAALVPGPPVLAWWLTAWVVKQNTSGQVTIHVSYCMVRLKGVTIRGLHGAIHSPLPPSSTQSQWRNYELEGP